MIVECQYCATRFQLDEGRIPPTGIRARCSQCKQAFFLEHPDASREDAVDAIVAATLDTPAQDVPQPAADLPSATAGEDEDDFDWEFNLDPPGAGPVDDEVEAVLPERSAFGPFGPSGLELAGNPEAALPPAEDCGREDTIDGTRETVPAESGPEVPLQANGPAAEARGSESVGLRPTPGVRSRPVATKPVRAETGSSPRGRVSPLPRVASGLGWAAVTSLFVLSVVRGLAGSSALPASVAAVDMGSFRVESVQTQWKPVAGHESLLVVRGVLHNPTARAQVLERALTVVWLDARGAPLDEPAVLAGRPLEEAVLPALDPEARERAGRASRAALSRVTVASGERVPFAAYIAAVPAGASRVAIRPGPFPNVASPPRTTTTDLLP